MRTLHDHVLDEPPASLSSALPALALGPLPQPGDRAGGDRAVEERFARAAQRKRAKKRGGAEAQQAERDGVRDKPEFDKQRHD